MDWGAYSEDGKKPLKLYHGTQSFGFTEFDLDRMDDKQSIFLTSDIETASTYSGVESESERKISDSVNVDKLSNEELAKYLTTNDKEYHYYSEEEALKIIEKAKELMNKVALETKSILENENLFLLDVEKEYFQKIISGAQTNDIREFLRGLIALKNYGSTDLIKLDISEAEKQIWLGKDIQDYLQHRGNQDIFVRTFIKDGFYGISSVYSTRNQAKYKEGKGNYSLYAKLENPLVVDVEGRNWNNVEFKAITNDKYIVQPSLYNKGKFEIINTLSLQPAWVKFEGKSVRLFDSEEQAQKAFETLDNRRTTILHKTREVSKYAKEKGYDSVIFKNIMDNGGRNNNKFVNAKHIIVVFNPSQIKSADPITYDDNGNVIPLSERFKEDNADIRFSIAETQNMDWEKQINGLLMHKKTIKHSDTLVIEKNTPKYLTDNGIDDLPLAIPISIITKSQKGSNESHKISNVNLVNLKNGIEHPIAVVNDNKRNSLLFVTNLKENNSNIVITFDKNALFDRDKVHKSTSIHSRKNLTAYFNDLKNAEIYLENENKLIAVSGSSINLERLKQNNKFINVNLSQENKNVNTKFSIDESFEDILNMSDEEYEEYSKQFDEDKNPQKTAEIYRYDEIIKEYGKVEKTIKERIADAPKSLKKQIAFKVKKKLDIATKKLAKSYNLNSEATNELLQAIDLFRTSEVKDLRLRTAVDTVYNNINGTNKHSKKFTDFASALKGQHIKINAKLKEELGDDYREFVQKYRRTFGLVTERSKYYANALSFDELASVLNEQGYNFNEQNSLNVQPHLVPYNLWSYPYNN